MFDSHCHLTDAQFDGDRDDVLARAWAAGLVGITTIASNAADAAAAIALAGTDPRIHATSGVHPHVAGDASDADLAQVEHHVRSGDVVAIGETGLDYHYDTWPRDTQRRLFEWHLTLAADSGLPVVVHCRSADDDVADMISTAGINGVLHCFAGDRRLFDAAMQAGWFISFAGIATFRNFANAELVAAVPAGRLLAETDSPYLAPVPHRGRRNEPARVMDTIGALAAMRQVPATQLALQVAQNAASFYRLPTAG